MSTKVKNYSMSEYIKKYALFGIILVIGVVFSFMSPYFLTADNLISIIRQATVMVVYAIGLTFVMIGGMIDISIVNIGLISTMIAGIMMENGQPVWLAILAAFAIGLIVGVVNGVMTTAFDLNPMIVTLGTSSLCSGGTLLICGGTSIYNLPSAFRWLGRGYLGIVPVQVVFMILIFIAAQIMLSKTVFGRRIYAIGGNAQVSKLAGIRVKTYQILLFVICSLCSVLAGLISSSKIATASSTPSANMFMNVLAAVVIGGTSLSGGKGSVVGSFFGALMLTMLSNGLTIIGLSSYWQTVISAIILLITIVMYRKD